MAGVAIVMFYIFLVCLMVWLVATFTAVLVNHRIRNGFITNKTRRRLTRVHKWVCRTRNITFMLTFVALIARVSLGVFL